MDEAQKKRRAELDERKATREAALKEARDVRDLDDDEAVETLEEQHGPGGVRVARLSQIEPPLPGLVVIRQPGSDYKVWKAAITRPQAKQIDKENANEDLAKQIVIYPSAEVYAQMVKKYPGIVAAIVHEANIFTGLLADERGKG